MKIEAPKKVDREAKKWAEHMEKKSKTAKTTENAEITQPQKKKSIEGKKIETNTQKEKTQQKTTQTTTQEKNETTKKTTAGKTGGKKSALEIEAALEDLEILKYPLVTEKAVNMIDAENKIIFVVDSKATKPLVRKAVESLYKVRVSEVNMLKDMKARKRAIVTLDKQFKAGDLATKLGVI